MRPDVRRIMGDCALGLIIPGRPALSYLKVTVPMHCIEQRC
jgi:hypothetical protein